MVYIAAIALVASLIQESDKVPDNPLIDYAGFEKQVIEVGRLRAKRRLTELQFVALAERKDVVILDARSREKYEQLHVRNAINLPLPDFTEAELRKRIPTSATKVLIYCNNNFRDAPESFPSKRLVAALNVHTFNALHSYGYDNVYELGPLLDVATTKLSFEGSRVERVRPRQKLTKQALKR